MPGLNARGRVRVRFQIIGNALIENVGKYQSCMVSKLPIIWKQTGPTCKYITMGSTQQEILTGRERERERESIIVQSLTEL